jgi:RNA polymerase sigma-B factor
MPTSHVRSKDLELHIRYAETRDPALRSQLLESYSGLVRSLARRFAGRGESIEDLMQVGFVGLLQALDRFDPVRGAPFLGFAVPTIVGELKRHFRDRRWKIRVPRQLQERYLEVRAARERLLQELGRNPTVHDIAADLSLPDDDVLEAMEAGSTFSMGSLDAPARDGGASPVRTGEGGYASVEDGLMVDWLLARLPAPQREVVVLRYYDELTQSEIGRRLGMGQMQVSRALARSIGWLRAAAMQD